MDCINTEDDFWKYQSSHISGENKTELGLSSEKIVSTIISIVNKILVDGRMQMK